MPLVTTRRGSGEDLVSSSAAVDQVLAMAVGQKRLGTLLLQRNHAAGPRMALLDQFMALRDGTTLKPPTNEWWNFCGDRDDDQLR